MATIPEKNWDKGIKTRLVRPPKAWFTLVIRIGDFLLLTYVNEYLNKLKYRTNLDCFCNGIEFTQSHQPEESSPNLTMSVNEA